MDVKRKRTRAILDYLTGEAGLALDSHLDLQEFVETLRAAVVKRPDILAELRPRLIELADGHKQNMELIEELERRCEQNDAAARAFIRADSPSNYLN